jgi:hypothetical protein
MKFTTDEEQMNLSPVEYSSERFVSSFKNILKGLFSPRLVRNMAFLPANRNTPLEVTPATLPSFDEVSASAANTPIQAGEW